MSRGKRSAEAKRRRRQRCREKDARNRMEQHGKPCVYCARPMNVNDSALYPTLDHVEPKSRGGRITVWACQTCNAVKRAMTEEQWSHYRNDHPGWWENGSRARKARNWRPRWSWTESKPIDNLPLSQSETGPEASGIAPAPTV